MPTTDDDLPEDYDALKAAFIEMRAKVSGAEALIAHLQLVIAKMKRELYGPRSERSQRLIDQLELQLEDMIAAAGEARPKPSGPMRCKATCGGQTHAVTFPIICRAGASCIPRRPAARAAAATSSPKSARTSPRRST